MIITKIILNNYKRLALNNIRYIELEPKHKIQLILGSNGSGKAQPLNAKIKVPNGWSTMGDMQIGSQVIARDGSICSVIGVYPQGIKDIYRITFADGRKTEVTADHLWKVYVGGRKYPIQPEITTTAKMIDLLQSCVGHLVWVDLCESEQNEDIDLPVDPYVLGVILGDGCLNGSIVVSHPDEFIMHKVMSKLNNNHKVSIRNVTDQKCLTYGVSAKYKKGPKSNELINYFRECNLFGTYAWEKFVPDIYLNASSRQRLELLQGLMDTDGTAGTQGSSSFSSTSRELSEAVQYLVRSLGGIAKISTRYPHYTYKGERKQGRQDYRVHIRHKRPEELFSLPKKKERVNNANQYSPTLKLRITNIEKIGTKKAQCIAIDHPEHLYITDDFIVTHNSSILSQMSPLPAAHQDFDKEGYKHIFIEYRNNHYELQNNFLSSGNKYHFIKNGEELNKSLTISVYKELVQQEFGLTQDIYDLITGVNNFHLMSPAERRKWLTLISDSDYTYAFNYYNALRDKLKDIQSLYKLNQSRLVQERNKILTPEQESSYRIDIDQLKELITKLIELKQPLVSNTKDRYMAIKEQLVNKTQLINKLQSELDIRNTSIDVLDQSIIDAKALEQSSQQQSLMHFNAIQQLEEKYTILEHTANESYETIDSNIDQLLQTVTTLKSQKQLGLTFDDPTVAFNAINTLYEQIITIYSELPPNTSGDFDNSVYITLENQYKETEVHIATLQHSIRRYEKTKQDLEHARDHQQHTCPKCNHVWSKGYTEESYQTLLAELESLEKKLIELNTLLKNTSMSLDAHRARLSSIQQFRLLSYNWSVLEPLWAYMAAEDMVYTYTDRVIPLIGQLMQDLKLDIRITDINKQINELIKLKALTDADQVLDKDKIKQQIEYHQAELYKLGDTIKTAKTSLSRYDNQKKIIIQLYQLRNELITLLNERDNTISLMKLSLKQHALNDTIRILQLELNQKEQLISKMDIQKGITESIQASLEQLEMHQSLLKIAIKELSPTEGLIAKGLTSFINHFVSHMNNFIRQIWLYPLELVPILPDENDDVDLDYKFSVKINDNIEISDISKGSSAMKEIINLAFRVISMSYLGLQDYPITIDELGNSFDKAHRQAAFHVIGNLLTNASFSQIFMVSHYHEMYGTLTDCDVSVLCPSNISLPKDALINQVLKMR